MNRGCQLLIGLLLRLTLFAAVIFSAQCFAIDSGSIGNRMAAVDRGSLWAAGGRDYRATVYANVDYGSRENAYQRQLKNPCYCRSYGGYCNLFRYGETRAFLSIKAESCSRNLCENHFGGEIRSQCEGYYAL